MPPRLRRLSGSDVLRILGRFGFEEAARRGSHVKLRRVESGKKEILTVPLHGELDTGTLHAIYRQASRFVDESALRPHFFTS